MEIATIYYIVKFLLDLYKAKKLQKSYFIKLVFVIISAFFYNIVSYFIVGSKEGFAVATLFSIITWYCFSIYDFKEIMPGRREHAFMILCLLCYLFLGLTSEPVKGFFIYILIVIIFSFLWLKQEAIYITKESIDIVQKKIMQMKRIRGS